MLEGFPLPDFDFDDDPAPTVFNNFHHSTTSLDSDDFEELFEKNGLELIQTTPLRSTGNSIVYSARNKYNDQPLAVKITPYKHRIEEEHKKRNQVSDSPYLVKSYECRKSPSKFLLEMELCELGDLTNFEANEYHMWKIIYDISNALEHLHSQNWIHLDVSPGNILMTKNLFKLADFGTLTLNGQFEEGNEGAGPYVSPEALAFPCGEYDVSFPTDIFSFGIVLYELASKKPAPRGGSKYYSLIRDGGLYLKSENFSNQLIELINDMIKPIPNNRPTSKDLINISFNVLKNKYL